MFQSVLPIISPLCLPGAWETKISNREKRQQRRKDKTASDDSGSPGGVEPAASISVEPLKTTVAAAPVVQKKNKGMGSVVLDASLAP